MLFAGITVILSLLGLFLLQLPFMRGLAIGAIAAVVLVMTAAITLLPAMLGFSGRAIDKLHVPGLLQSAAEPSARGFWYRWSRTVQRHPLLAGVAALLVLVCLALPALLDATGLHRRRERSPQRHDPTGLRRSGHRIRTRIQRAPDRRGQGPRRRTGSCRPPGRPPSRAPPGWPS